MKVILKNSHGEVVGISDLPSVNLFDVLQFGAVRVVVEEFQSETIARAHYVGNSENRYKVVVC